MVRATCGRGTARLRRQALQHLREQAADDVVDRLRIGLAFGGFHYLADEKFEDAFVAGFEFGDVVGIFLDHFACGFFDSVVPNLGAEAFGSDDFGGGAARFKHGGEDFLGDGGGDFAGRFPSYVDAVRNRISSNWLQSTVDPSIRWAPRANFTFQVLKDGTVANVQMTQSSGNRSVDNSALRAILSSSPVSPLPSNYSGSSVTVEFYFDFRR